MVNIREEFVQACDIEAALRGSIRILLKAIVLRSFICCFMARYWRAIATAPLCIPCLHDYKPRHPLTVRKFSAPFRNAARLHRGSIAHARYILHASLITIYLACWDPIAPPERNVADSTRLLLCRRSLQCRLSLCFRSCIPAALPLCTANTRKSL